MLSWSLLQQHHVGKRRYSLSLLSTSSSWLRELYVGDHVPAGPAVHGRRPVQRSEGLRRHRRGVASGGGRVGGQEGWAVCVLQLREPHPQGDGLHRP